MPSAIEEASKIAAVEAPPAAPPPAETSATPAAAPTPPPAAPAEPAAQTPPDATSAPQSAVEKAAAKIEGVLGKKGKDAAKPAESAKDDLDEAGMEKVIKANPKAWRVYEGYKKSTAGKIAELEAKIRASESKPAPTATDDAKLKALEKQLEELSGETKTYKQRLAERDYTQSEEYKEKFITPWNRAFKEAHDFVGGLQLLDAEGQVVRPATAADFDRIMAAEPQQRRLLAKQMFGEDYASDIVDHAKELSRINRGASEAIAEHAKNFEKVNAERQTASQKEREQYGQFKTEAQKELESKYPQFFSVDHYKDQPELQAALQGGYEFLDDTEKAMPTMGVKDRAASVAVLRSYVAAVPLLIKQNEEWKAKWESANAELAKFRKSDPGSVTPGAQTTLAVEEIGGINEASKKFNQV